MKDLIDYSRETGTRPMGMFDEFLLGLLFYYFYFYVGDFLKVSPWMFPAKIHAHCAVAMIIILITIIPYLSYVVTLGTELFIYLFILFQRVWPSSLGGQVLHLGSIVKLHSLRDSSSSSSSNCKQYPRTQTVIEVQPKSQCKSLLAIVWLV